MNTKKEQQKQNTKRNNYELYNRFLINKIDRNYKSNFLIII